VNTTEGIRQTPISLSQSLLLPQHKTTQGIDLSFPSHCDLSIEQVCLGNNIADRNHRQGKSHVGENQELPATASNLVITTLDQNFAYLLFT